MERLGLWDKWGHLCVGGEHSCVWGCVFMCVGVHVFGYSCTSEYVHILENITHLHLMSFFNHSLPFVFKTESLTKTKAHGFA